MRATIKMIAERAGVSIGTVDRVLHDRPYVKAEVRERILQVMEELDYRPNRMASALATSGTPRRFVVVQPAWKEYLGEAMAQGVAQFRKARRDYNLTVDVLEYPRNDMAACLRLLEQVEREGAQGIALSGFDCESVRRKLEELSQRRIPVVTFNSDIANAPRLCYVGENARRAGRTAGEIASKFYRPGDRMLLVYGGPEFAGHKARAEGFLERLEEVGIPREVCRLAATHNEYAETLEAVSQALEQEPALHYIYMANVSVPACVEAVRKAGKTGQVRILAHDISPEIRAFLKEGVVDFAIDQNLTYQIRHALELLFCAVVENRMPKQECYYPENPILNAENS